MTWKRILLLGVIAIHVSAFPFPADLNSFGQFLQAASYSSVDDMVFAAFNVLESSPTLPNQQQRSRQLTPFVQHLESGQAATFDMRQEVPLLPTIFLTTTEVELFDLVKRVREQYCPTTTLRVAGGWVRDKLLGRSSSNCDIDFVLNDVSGSEFARHVQHYLQQHNTNYTTLGQVAGIKDFGNTEIASQHLQTATLVLDNLEVDFCQLRLEKYAVDSRVPAETVTASIVQDAFRRDLTINALYFNLNTNQVEDWTEQGLLDLQDRTIATPRAALPTLLEDPLRILRAVRFAAQLSFPLMNRKLKKAALDERVRSALRVKVSPDRVGKEIDALMKTSNPTLGMNLLLELRLVEILFPLPENDTNPFSIYTAAFQQLFRTQTLLNRIVFGADNWDTTRRKYLWYAGFCQPIHNAFPHDGVPPKKSKKHKTVVQQILSQRLKRPTQDMQSVEAIIRGAEHLAFFVRKYHPKMLLQDGTNLKDIRWLAYKLLKRVGPLWKESLVLALALNHNYLLAQAVERYHDWVATIEETLGLNETLLASLPPLLNGSEIQQHLPGVRGAHFRRIQYAQEKWQVQQLSQQKDNLIQHLIQTFPEYLL